MEIKVGKTRESEYEYEESAYAERKINTKTKEIEESKTKEIEESKTKEIKENKDENDSTLFKNPKEIKRRDYFEDIKGRKDPEENKMNQEKMHRLNIELISLPTLIKQLGENIKKCENEFLPIEQERDYYKKTYDTYLLEIDEFKKYYLALMKKEKEALKDPLDQEGEAVSKKESIQDQTPQIQTPQITSKDQTPQITSKDQTPQITSKDQTPQIQSLENPSKDQTPQSTSKDKTPQIQSLENPSKDQTPQSQALESTSNDQKENLHNIPKESKNISQNDELTKLQEEIKKLKVETGKDPILQKEMAQKEEKITELTDQISQLNTKITELEKNSKNNTGFGDSGDSGGDSGGNNENIDTYNYDQLKMFSSVYIVPKIKMIPKNSNKLFLVTNNPHLMSNKKNNRPFVKMQFNPKNAPSGIYYNSSFNSPIYL